MICSRISYKILRVIFQIFFLSNILLQSHATTFFNGIAEGNRSSKWLPFIVQFGNDPCNSTDSHEVGTCFTTAQCKRAGGLPKGKCASGFGVCCVSVATCFDTITTNNTYFRSKGFPDPIRPNGHQVCPMKIKKPSKDVCQVLLTFHEMELAQGNANGHCLFDSIKIFGTRNGNLPHLCGPLSDQHLYLEFGDQDFMKLKISIDGNQDNSMGRKWNVQIAFIKCDDLHRAPSGCLQYFTKSRGSVKMLGFPAIPHLAGLFYTICVRKELGAESIFWYPCREVPIENAFHLLGPNILLSGFSIYWQNCFGDYIVIMSDKTSVAAGTRPSDRYCGNRLTGLPPFYVHSKATPYMVAVRTNLVEEAFDQDNSGFCLEWQQVIFELDENSPVMSMPPDGGAPPEGGPFQRFLKRVNSKHYEWKSNLI